MKIIRYTLLANGKVPEAMFDGGYFPKPNREQSPQDYDLIGYSRNWDGFISDVKISSAIKSSTEAII